MFHDKELVCTVPLRSGSGETDGEVVVRRSLVSGALFITSDHRVREQQYMGYSVHHAIECYVEFLVEHLGLDVALADGWDVDFGDDMHVDPWGCYDDDDEPEAYHVDASVCSRSEGYE